MAETTKERDDDEARANDTITAYNRALVGDSPPDDDPATKMAYALHVEAQQRAFAEGWRRQRAAHAARLRQFGIEE